jgi:M-phase inducer tyrosine phosphatase
MAAKGSPLQGPAAVPSLGRSCNTFKRITSDELCALYENHPKFDRVLVVDCRTQREYNAGHIKGAIRRHPQEPGFDQFYAEEYSPMTLFVFHCELSSFRAPCAICRFMRLHADAGRTEDSLHALVLLGGYRAFFQLHRKLCEGGYQPQYS